MHTCDGLFLLVNYWSKRFAAYRMEVEATVHRFVNLSDDGNVVTANYVQTEHDLFDASRNGEYSLV